MANSFEGGYEVAKPSRHQTIVDERAGVVARHTRPPDGRGPGERSEIRESCAVTQCTRAARQSCHASRRRVHACLAVLRSIGLRTLALHEFNITIPFLRDH